MKRFIKSCSILCSTLLLAACVSTPKDDNQKLQPKTSDALYKYQPKSDEYKNWVFVQDIKIRIAPEPSAKIIGKINEGDKINAYIEEAAGDANGWFVFKSKQIENGFFFGNFHKETKK